MAEKIEVGLVVKGASKAITDFGKIGEASQNLGGDLEGNNAIVEHLTGSLDQMTNGAFSGFKNAAMGLKTFITGLKTTKTAIIATGIGALVVAFGLLVTYWDDIKVLVNGVSSEQKELLKFAEATRDAAQDQLDITNQTEATLKLQGMSERDILNSKRLSTEKIIEANILILESQQEQKKEAIEQAKRNQKIAATFIAMMNLPLTMMLGSIDAVSAGLAKLGLIDKATNLLEKANMYQASFLFDPEKVEEEGDAVIEKTEDALRKLRNTRDSFINQRNDEDAAAEKARKDKADKLQDEADAEAKEKADKQKAIDDAKIAAQIKLEDELYALSLSAYDRAELALQQEFDKRVEMAGTNDQLIKDAEQRLIDDLAALKKKADEDAAAAQKVLDDKQAVKDEKRIAKEKAVADAIKTARMSVVSSGFDALNAMAKTEEGQKKLAIAQILVNQGMAMSSAIAGAQAAALAAGPAAPVVSPLLTAQMIGIVLTSFASIKGVMNQAGASAEGIGTGGGGVGGGLGIASNREGPTLGLTPDMQDAVTPGSIPPINAYVVQSQLADQNALAAQIRTATTL